METVQLGWAFGLLVALLAVAAAAATRLAGLGSWRAPLTATARAAAQLALVSLVITAALHSLPATAAFVATMVVVGALTSAQRVVGGHGRHTAWFALPIAVGALPVLLAVVAAGVVPAEPVAVLPVAGILVGGAMSATTLAARRTVEELTDQRGAYEAALSLGLPRRAAVDVVGRPAAALALVPGLDQTRTVGLVTLPGAFVGVLLAGASPVQAGAAQLLVLAGLLAAQTLAAAAAVELVAAGRIPVAGAPLRE
ncbi:ABC transporter permease [Nocardioides sp. CPCC 205120]|uniref:ABC transporter permease n=1 Tax=Nocardioides sp. CPCC 205120 TaxID=3406462 RepID=UPI003B508DF8